MNPLTDILSPSLRKYLYAAYALAGVVLGGLQVGYGSEGPGWLDVALRVFAYLGIALGATAASNVTLSGPASSPDNNQE